MQTNQYENFLLRRLAAFNPLLLRHREDALQEIRIALLLHNGSNTFRIAAGLTYRLCRDLGYRRKQRTPWINAQPSIVHEHDALLTSIEQHYRRHTAKETMAAFSITNQQAAKWLCLAFPKAMGRGGARKGAGRKKISA